jgi:hypothetical protein
MTITTSVIILISLHQLHHGNGLTGAVRLGFRRPRIVEDGYGLRMTNGRVRVYMYSSRTTLLIALVLSPARLPPLLLQDGAD